jgi:hypothetical protein
MWRIYFYLRGLNTVILKNDTAVIRFDAKSTVFDAVNGKSECRSTLTASSGACKIKKEWFI